MIENVSSFARAADVVIDLLREMLDELRGMRIEVTQTLGSIRTDLTTLQAELDRVGKALVQSPDTPPPPRPSPVHRSATKHATRGPARRR
ncbi:MAG: hypothetical protein U0610_05770 [bacterium]